MTSTTASKLREPKVWRWGRDAKGVASGYWIVSGEYTITKHVVAGEPRYLVYHGKMLLAGGFKDNQSAREFSARHEEDGHEQSTQSTAKPVGL